MNNRLNECIKNLFQLLLLNRERKRERERERVGVGVKKDYLNESDS
jgi:hypothetical protein